MTLISSPSLPLPLSSKDLIKCLEDLNHLQRMDLAAKWAHAHRSNPSLDTLLNELLTTQEVKLPIYYKETMDDEPLVKSLVPDLIVTDASDRYFTRFIGVHMAIVSKRTDILLDRVLVHPSSIGKLRVIKFCAQQATTEQLSRAFVLLDPQVQSRLLTVVKKVKRPDALAALEPLVTSASVGVYPNLRRVVPPKKTLDQVLAILESQLKKGAPDEYHRIWQTCLSQYKHVTENVIPSYYRSHHIEKVFALQEAFPPTVRQHNNSLWVQLNPIIASKFVIFLRNNPSQAIGLIQKTCCQYKDHDLKLPALIFPKEFTQDSGHFWTRHTDQLPLLLKTISHIFKKSEFLSPLADSEIWKLGPHSVREHLFNLCIQTLTSHHPTDPESEKPSEIMYWQTLCLVFEIISEMDKRLIIVLNKRATETTIQQGLTYASAVNKMLNALTPIFERIFHLNPKVAVNKFIQPLISKLQSQVMAQYATDTIYKIYSRDQSSFRQNAKHLVKFAKIFTHLISLLSKRSSYEKIKEPKVLDHLPEQNSDSIFQLILKFEGHAWNKFEKYSFSQHMSPSQQEELFDSISDKEWVDSYYGKEVSHAIYIPSFLKEVNVPRAKKHRVVTLLYSSIPDNYESSYNLERPLDALLDLSDPEVYSAAKKASFCPSWEERFVRFTNLLSASTASFDIWLATFEFVFNRIKNESTQNLSSMMLDFFCGNDRKAFLGLLCGTLSQDQKDLLVKTMTDTHKKSLNFANPCDAVNSFFEFFATSCYKFFVSVPSDARFQLAVSIIWEGSLVTKGSQNVLKEFILPDLHLQPSERHNFPLPDHTVDNTCIHEGKEADVFTTIVETYTAQYRSIDIVLEDHAVEYVGKVRPCFQAIGPQWIEFEPYRLFVRYCLQNWKSSIPAKRNHMEFLEKFICGVFDKVDVEKRVNDSLYIESMELSLTAPNRNWSWCSRNWNWRSAVSLLSKDFNILHKSKKIDSREIGLYAKYASKGSLFFPPRDSSTILYNYLHQYLPKNQLPLLFSELAGEDSDSDESEKKAILDERNDIVCNFGFPYLHRLLPTQLAFLKNALKSRIESTLLTTKHRRKAMGLFMRLGNLTVSEATELMSSPDIPSSVLDTALQSLHNLTEPLPALSYFIKGDVLESDSSHNGASSFSRLLNRIPDSEKLALIAPLLETRRVVTGTAKDGKSVTQKRGPKSILSKTLVRVITRDIDQGETLSFIRTLWDKKYLNSGVRLALLKELVGLLSHKSQAVRDLAWDIVKESVGERRFVLDKTIAALLSFDVPQQPIPSDIRSINLSFSITDPMTAAADNLGETSLQKEILAEYAEYVLLPLVMMDESKEKTKEGRDLVFTSRFLALTELSRSMNWFTTEKADHFASQFFNALHSMSPNFIFPSPTNSFHSNPARVTFVIRLLMCIGICVYKSNSMTSASWSHLKDILVRWKNIFIDLGWDHEERMICLDWLQHMSKHGAFLFNASETKNSQETQLDPRELTACFEQHWLSHSVFWNWLLTREVSVLLDHIAPAKYAKLLEAETIQKAKDFVGKAITIAREKSIEPDPVFSLIDTVCTRLKLQFAARETPLNDRFFSRHIFGANNYPGGEIWFFETHLHLFHRYRAELDVHVIRDFIAFCIGKHPQRIEKLLRKLVTGALQLKDRDEAFLALAQITDSDMKKITSHYMETDTLLPWSLTHEVSYMLFQHNPVTFTNRYGYEVGSFLRHVLLFGKEPNEVVPTVEQANREDVFSAFRQIIDPQIQKIVSHYGESDRPLPWTPFDEVAYLLFDKDPVYFIMKYPSQVGSLLRHVLVASEKQGDILFDQVYDSLVKILQPADQKKSSLRVSKTDRPHATEYRIFLALLSRVFWEEKIQYLDLTDVGEMVHKIKRNAKGLYDNASPNDVGMFRSDAPQSIKGEDPFISFSSSSKFLGQGYLKNCSILLHQTRLFLDVVVWPEIRDMMMEPASFVPSPDFLSHIRHELSFSNHFENPQAWDSVFLVVSALYEGRGIDNQEGLARQSCIYYSYLIFEEVLQMVLNLKSGKEGVPTNLRDHLQRWYTAFSASDMVLGIPGKLVKLLRQKSFFERLQNLLRGELVQ